MKPDKEEIRVFVGEENERMNRSIFDFGRQSAAVSLSCPLTYKDIVWDNPQQ